MVSTPFSRMGPPPRSFAADAHDCIRVRPLWTDRIQGCGAVIRARWQAPLWSSMLGFRRAPCPLDSEQGPVTARVAATGMFGRRDPANRAIVPPAHLAILPRLDAKT